jgi:hypothetical protein
MAALTETTNSGADVPKPTIRRPLSKGDIPKRLAADSAPRINISPPQVSKATPRKRNNMFNIFQIFQT